MNYCHRVSLALLIVVIIGGCVSLPVQPLRATPGYSQAALNPAHIVIVSWNIKKGDAAHWREGLAGRALQEHLLSADLLLLQEACSPMPGLASLLRDAGYGWRFAASFESAALGCGHGLATGVLTASRAAPVAAQALRSRAQEFGLTPKSALLTTFALAGRDDVLLVVNAHLLNFELIGADAFAAQLNRIAKAIAGHRGPVVFAGDLNTRTDKRQGLVDKVAANLGLHSVFGSAKKGRTTAVFGANRPLDHVYTRGLRQQSQGVVGHEAERGQSDHNSLRLGVALPEQR